MTKPTPPRTPCRFPGPGELERMVCDAINVADNDGTVAELWDRAHREPEIDEQKLWKSRFCDTSTPRHCPGRWTRVACSP